MQYPLPVSYSESGAFAGRSQRGLGNAHMSVAERIPVARDCDTTRHDSVSMKVPSSFVGGKVPEHWVLSFSAVLLFSAVVCVARLTQTHYIGEMSPHARCQ